MAAVNLWIDIESRSAIDLKGRGLDVYSKDPSTQITLCAWCINDANPTIWRPITEQIPEQLQLLLTRSEIPKLCFNSQFEQTMLREVLEIDIPTEQFVDVATLCRYASIAGNLEFCGKVLGIDEDKAKMAVGRRLIAKFCTPKKGVFRDWVSDPEDWALFEQYCCNDVLAERAIYEKLKAFHLPAQERKIWILDQEINRRGIPVDMDFVEKSSQIVKSEHEDLTTEFKALTGLENPNSVSQLLGWLKEQGYEYGSLGARWVRKALADGNTNVTARRALELRQLLAKSSTAKLETLKNLVGPDGRLRYQFVYGGAARTLRWSGRGAQPHNFPRPSIADVAGATEVILTGDREKVRAFGPPLAVVSSCLRGAFKAPVGEHFVVCDLASIETRVSAWVAGCDSLLRVFEQGRDPYIEFATKMFHIPYEEITKQQRQLAKPAILGACYGLGGGGDATDKNGDDVRTGLYGYSANMNVEMTQEFAHECVQVYRQSYPEIPSAWRKLEKAATLACQTGLPHSTCRVLFHAIPNKLLYITLPSGRRLSYIRPQLEETTWGGEPSYKLSYENNILGGWGRTHTFGGKILENDVQSVSRDILAAGMLRAAEAGFSIVMHAHDEIVACEEIGSPLNGEKLRECMIAPLDWALDLPLGAEAYEAERYRK
jgi:DNA polymerase